MVLQFAVSRADASSSRIPQGIAKIIQTSLKANPQSLDMANVTSLIRFLIAMTVVQCAPNVVKLYSDEIIDEISLLGGQSVID